MTHITALPTPDSVSATQRAARRLAGVVFVICLIPITLSLLGVDFGTRGPAFDIETAATLSPGGQTDAMFHSLRGSYTHTLLEWSAFCTALFTVMLAFVVFRIKGDVITPIIAMALFWAGCMDAFHTLAADRLIEATADNKNLIPFTWAICRAFNALIGIAGVAVVLARGRRKRTHASNFTAIAVVSVVFGGFAYGVIHYCATHENLPKTMFPDSLVTRPWDTVALFLFVVNAGVFWLLYRRIGGVFAAAMLISAIPNIATQLHMAFGSTALFDNHFNVAHFLKIVTYLVPFMGLSIDYVATYRQEQMAAQSLKSEIRERQQALQQLRENEAKVRAVLDTAPDAIITINQGGAIESINSTGVNMFGYTVQELIGRNIKMLMPSPYQEEHDGYLEAYLRTGHRKIIGSSREVEGQRKDGSVFPISLAIGEFKQGDKSYFTGIIQDISNPKQAEEALRTSESRLALAVRGTSEGLWDWNIATNEVWYAPRYKKLLGYAEDKFPDTFESYESRLHPEDKDPTLKAIHKHLEERKPYDVEHRLMNKNGEYRWFRVRGIAEHDDQGKPIRMAGSMQDIHDQKRAQEEINRYAGDLWRAREEIRISQKRFEIAVDGASDGLWDWDIVANEVWYSPRFKDLLGYTDHDFQNVIESWKAVLHPDHRQFVMESLTRHLEANQPFDVEYRAQTKRGEYRWFRSRGKAIRDKSSKAIRMAGSIQDITDRKHVEVELAHRAQELEKSNKELDDFAYIASHDLKEPLRGIHNYATFLIEDYQDTIDEDGMAKLATLQRLTQRMEKLIDTLLEFSRVGRVDMAIEDTDLNQVLGEVMESLQVTLNQDNIEVRTPISLPTVHCDRARIGEVFRNLMTNAMKYNDKSEKWIEVGVACSEPGDGTPEAEGDEGGTGSQYVFYVRDNGIGIPEKHMDSIFRIFKRLHGRDKFGGGTGAGLTIVKKIVERHGGQVWVESTHGQGTTFKFTLGKAA